jgi:muramoyltetrapeptide carboxypeptidase LdcA involved in peptidoglycan recycling
MIKPQRLQKGDKIAVVSLSWGGLGDQQFIHKYELAKQRLEDDFGLVVVAMPHALMGSEFIAHHPNLRAQDLMQAFSDPTIKGIFCAIGGDDTIRTLPYIDYSVIKNNPKIFMGYSDSTINHLMMYQCGLVSFYGPSVMCELGEYHHIFDYTTAAINNILFNDSAGYVITASLEWTDDFIPWDIRNINRQYHMRPETRGHELLQGKGKVRGHLLGGCLDVFMMACGTAIWPSIAQWQGAILFVETSEDKPSPDLVKYTFRNLAAQGILQVLNGIIVGKPQGEVYYAEYQSVIRQVVAEEEQLNDLPILYNVNFGHARPIGILPYGINIEIDCDNRLITLLESATLQ